MPLTIQEHCLSEAQYIPSPHADERPDPADISLLVVHNISLPPGQFGGPYISDLFTGTLDTTAHPWFSRLAGVRVSAHVLIRRQGDMLQYVPFDRRAWHAGESCFAGRQRCNDFAIGIELEGTDATPYTEQQYHQLARVTAALMARYPKLTRERITGHEHIAPGRKTDPGPAFNWADFRHRLKAQEGIMST